MKKSLGKSFDNWQKIKTIGMWIWQQPLSERQILSASRPNAARRTAVDWGNVGKLDNPRQPRPNCINNSTFSELILSVQAVVRYHMTYRFNTSCIFLNYLYFHQDLFCVSWHYKNNSPGKILENARSSSKTLRWFILRAFNSKTNQLKWSNGLPWVF